jgi:quinol monooxygenase YgiN
MVVEYIRYSVDEGRADAFEDAYRRATEALDASEHCERYEISR